MDSGISSGSQLRCGIRSYRRKEEKKRKNPLNKDPPLTLPRLQSCPQQTQSSTNSKAQPPNLDDARQAFPTFSTALTGIGRRLTNALTHSRRRESTVLLEEPETLEAELWQEEEAGQMLRQKRTGMG